MELRKTCYALLLLVILLCALNTMSKMMRREEMFYGNYYIRNDKQFAELPCIRCKKELMDNQYYVEGHDLHLPEKETINLESIYIHETISSLPFELQQQLHDCLRKKNLIFCVSSLGDCPTCCFIKCSETVFSWQSSSRRSLAGESHGKTEPSSFTSLQIPEFAAALPDYNPPSPPSNLAATNSRSQYQQAHPPFQMKILQKPDVYDQDVNNLPPLRPHARKLKKRHKKKRSHHSIKKDILIAVIATASTTFCLVAALFICWLCYRRKNKSEPRDRQRDNRPLLNLSDLSASSSHNSSSFGNSNSQVYGSYSDSKKATTFEINPSVKNMNPVSSVAELPTMKVNAGGEFHLKPPPGRPLSMKPATPEIQAAEMLTPAEKLAPGKPAPPAPPHPRAPPPPPPPSAGPRAPPPPPKGVRAPPAPPPKAKPVPPGPRRQGKNESSDKENTLDSSGSSKTKLKPFFWDKVMANPGHSMVWHEISSGSFQFNEEMIESLFGYQAAGKSKSDPKKDSSENAIQYIQIIDARKAQNLSILLKALNVTSDEVLDALREGTELPVELVQTLLKMAPTSEEELKLRLFMGDINQLGPAERFLKIVVEIPFAFKRMESLLFMTCLQEELSTLTESYRTLEVACDKLRNSRLFLKLLEAVLKTGNRMNVGTYRGGAQAFKLDTLLKLSDVKGTDGKTTLLHFVVQEIIRSEGIRAVRSARASQSTSSVNSDDLIGDSDQESVEHYRNLGLKVVSGLSTELEDVRRAAAVDADVLTSTVSKLSQSLVKSKAFLGSELKSLEEETKFYPTLATFLDNADSQISWVSKEEKRIMALVQSTADYFHGNAGKNEGLRLFTIVRDFLVMLDKACKDVRDDRAAKPMKAIKRETPAFSVSDSPDRQPSDIRREKLFPAIQGRRGDYSSSDDESPSP